MHDVETDNDSELWSGSYFIQVRYQYLFAQLQWWLVMMWDSSSVCLCMSRIQTASEIFLCKCWKSGVMRRNAVQKRLLLYYSMRTFIFHSFLLTLRLHFPFPSSESPASIHTTVRSADHSFCLAYLYPTSLLSNRPLPAFVHTLAILSRIRRYVEGFQRPCVFEIQP